MQSQARVPYRGVMFEFGDSPLIIPALTVNQAEELAADIDLAQAPIDPTLQSTIANDYEEYKKFKVKIRERQAAMRRVIAVAARRNYPDITDEEINNFVDVDNIVSLFSAAMGLSELPKVRSSANGQPHNPVRSGESLTGGESDQG